MDRSQAAERLALLTEFDGILDDGRPRIDLWRTIEQSAYPGA